MRRMTDLLSRLREIILDRESGSSEIGLKLLRLIRDEIGPDLEIRPAELLESMLSIALERSSMILQINLLSVMREAVLQLQPSVKILTKMSSRLLEIYADTLSAAVSNAVRELEGISRIFTLSYSSQVFKTLSGLRNVAVYLTAGWPLLDGLKTGERLRSLGIEVHVYPDAALAEAVEQSDAVLVGSDAVLRDGTLINRSGTLLAALVSDGKKPVISIVDSFKLDRLGVWRPEYTTHFQDNFRLSYRLFEATSPSFFTAYVSELGALRPVEFVKLAEGKISEIIKELAEPTIY